MLAMKHEKIEGVLKCYFLYLKINFYHASYVELLILILGFTLSIKTLHVMMYTHTSMYSLF